MSDTLKTVIRYVITLVGAWLIGKNVSLFGQPLDTSTVEILGGIVLTIAATVWSWLAKELTMESFEGAIRHIVVTGGAILVTAGRMSAESLTMWIGLVSAIAPIIGSYIFKLKNT